jgi:prepilin-type processing-associated H-X9-DG protein
MKIIFPEQKSRGLTRINVVVIVLVTVVWLFLFMAVPVFMAAHRRTERVTCIENLRQLGEALSPWEDGNGSTNGNGNAHGSWAAPLETNAQTVGLNDGQIAWMNIMGITNFVRSAKFLQCPADKETPTTAGPAGLKIRISYFLNLDANQGYPQQMMAGDDNIELGDAAYHSPLMVNGVAVTNVPVKPGILILPSNTPFSWTGARHITVGNILFCDGSVDQQSDWILAQNFQMSASQTNGVDTNRIAIP